MFGVRRGDNLLSNNTCDEISGSQKIYRENKNLQKWSEVKKYYEDWEFKSVEFDSLIVQSRLTEYRNSWKNFGSHFAEHYTKKLNLKNNLKTDEKFDQTGNNIHFILCLDESSSMAGWKYKIGLGIGANSAWEGVKSAVKSLLSNPIMKDPEYKISIISFNTEAQIRCKYEEINDALVSKYLESFSGGDTDFIAPIRSSFKIIQEIATTSFDKYNFNIIYYNSFFIKGILYYYIQMAKQIIKEKK